MGPAREVLRRRSIHSFMAWVRAAGIRRVAGDTRSFGTEGILADGAGRAKNK